MTESSRQPWEDLRQLGIDLNEAGRRAFPVELRHGLRKPAIEGYFGDEPFAPLRVSATFPWERAMAVGIAVPPGCVVLDLDEKNGRHGEADLEALIRAYGPLDQRVQQVTPNGGRHLAFRLGDLADANLWGELRLADGTGSGIDVLRERHRYVMVYQPETWFAGPETWPVLPAAWAPAIVRPPSVTIVGSPRSSAGASTPSIEAVLSSRPGERNTVLFKAVCDELRRDPSTPLDGFLDAALAVGLYENEARATIASAKSNVLRFLEMVDRWEDAAVACARPRTASSTRAVVSAIGSVVRQARQMDKVGLGVRQLAAESGLSVNTVMNRLTDLRKAGLLQSYYDSDRMKAQRYRLVVPATASVTVTQGDEVSNSHVKNKGISAGLSESSSPSGGTQREVRRLGTSLKRRSAFLRAGGGASMPPSCADVLASVYLGLTTAAEIRKAVGLSRDTVRAGLRALCDACLIDFDEDLGKFSPAYTDAEEAVTVWESVKKVPDRAKAKRDRYRAEQEAHALRNALLSADRGESTQGRQPGTAAG